MLRSSIASAVVSLVVAVAIGRAQSPAKVDFRRDVQTLLKDHCVSCHGSTQQSNGLRLDRRRDVMRDGTAQAVVHPGDSAGSRLYQRVTGNRLGTQMPPAGPLTPEQLDTIKNWIDQGAEWPDDASGETVPDPKATDVMAAIRRGDRAAVEARLAVDSAVARLKGPGGSTPLMYAALYGDSAMVRLLLTRGSDPNSRNDAGATALMWALDDPEKTRLLLDAGADANAASDTGRKPLLIAANRFGSVDVARLLLDHGADPSARQAGTVTVLSEAAGAGDEATLQLLLDRGADLKGAGFFPFYWAERLGCLPCAGLLHRFIAPATLNVVLVFLAPPRSDGRGIVRLVDRGANVNATDLEGRSVLMLAASSDALLVDEMNALIAHGADVNAKSPAGDTALGFAKLRGRTAVVDLLLKAGVADLPATPAPERPAVAGNTIRTALERSLPLLQRTDVAFLQKSGCVSCHNNSLTSLAVATARAHGVPVDEGAASHQREAIGRFVESWRERVLQGVSIPGDSFTVSYILLGMAAEHYPPDAGTDALARYLRHHQSQDGRWQSLEHRPPLESNDIQATATALRAVQVYAPAARRSNYEPVMRSAAAWLAAAVPRTTDASAFHLLGLKWAGIDQAAIRARARALLAEQRADGGWAQLPTMTSDAYATGQALFALYEVGATRPRDPAYRRGVEFLLRTQLPDGSWHVKTRALRTQPLFESGFPHGRDQWISAAATSWASSALAIAAK